MDSQTKSSQVADTVAALKGIPTRERLQELLETETLYVTFDKLSGDERTMPCTLIKEYLPPATREDALSQARVRNLEDKVVTVWSLEANNWRSFRYDRIKKVEIFAPAGGG